MDNNFITECITEKGGLYRIENYVNGKKVNRRYDGLSKKEVSKLKMIDNPDHFRDMFRKSVHNMVVSDKANTLNPDYVMDLFETSSIILVKYSTKNKLEAFCIAQMMVDSLHIDIIMAAPGQGNVFMKNIVAIATRDEYRKNYITLDSLPEPLGFYLKTGFKLLTKEKKNELMPNRGNIQNVKSKKLHTPLRALNRKSGLRWNQNTKDSSKAAAEELFKYLPKTKLKKLDSWNGITNQLQNSNGIYLYDKITIIMYKRITPEPVPSPPSSTKRSSIKTPIRSRSKSVKSSRRILQSNKTSTLKTKRKRSSGQNNPKKKPKKSRKIKCEQNNSILGNICSMMGGAWPLL